MSWARSLDLWLLQPCLLPLFTCQRRGRRIDTTEYPFAEAFQFVTGLMSAARLGIQFWTCLERTGLHHTTKFADNSCALEAPGQDSYFPLVLLLELTRACLLVVTAILLGGGTAHGGGPTL